MARRPIDFSPSQIEELINLARNNFSTEEMATYFGVNGNALRAWLRRRQNRYLRDKMEQEKMRAIAAVRGALMRKALGQKPVKGTPEIRSEDGKVIKEGSPEVVGFPGELAAEKYWLQNCDPHKRWIDARQNNLAGPDGKPLSLSVQEMSKTDLVELIVEKIKQGILPAERIRKLAPGNGKAVRAKFREIKDEPHAKSPSDL